MNTLKAILVDDEFRVREVLESLLKTYCPQLQILSSIGDINTAYREITEHQPEIVFLDIEMPNGNGFELLQKFNTIPFQIIFVTSHSHYALHAIKFSALDYLLKPVIPEELIAAVKKAEERIGQNNLQVKIEALTQNLKNSDKEHKKIVLKTAEQIFVVDVKDIIRLEADMKYTTFFLIDGRKILVSRTLKDFDEMLSDYAFFRAHQSHLINMHLFKRYDKRDGGFAVMNDDSKVPVAVRKKEELLAILNKL